MIYLWKGHHSPELRDQLKKAWDAGDLFILCPPTLQDFSFLAFVPKGPITTLGSFTPEELAKIEKEKTNLGARTLPFPAAPLIGVFTSGTLSGKPRLALYSKKNVEASLAGIRTFFDTSRLQEIFCYPPPFHTFGLVLGYLQSILFDIPLHIPHGRYSKEAHQWRAKLTNPGLLTLGTPSHFFDLIQITQEQNVELAPSYSAIIGGAKVNVSLWNEIKNTLHIEQPSIGYGATEACPGVTHHPLGRAPLEEGEIGFPIPGVAVTLIEKEGLKFSGENVCLAIIENQELHFPQSMVLADWVEKRESDNMLIYRGRRGLILNRGGTKYALEAIEDLLWQKAQVKCAATPITDARLVEDLGLVIVADNEEQLQTRREECAMALAQYYGHRFLLPQVARVSALPLNENGKIDRVQISKIISVV